jgi:hypothetical protein
VSEQRNIALFLLYRQGAEALLEGTSHGIKASDHEKLQEWYHLATNSSY